MDALLREVRSGDWLTAGRIRLWAAAALAASGAGLLFLIVTSNGLIDYQSRPLGSDFSNVYAAGSYVLEGKAEAPFGWPAQFAREKAIFGADTQFYGWHYPPFFLFVAGALATMPYLLALAVWQGVTFALYLFSIRTILSVVVPSPRWGEGVGGLRPPFFMSRTPMQSIGYGEGDRTSRSVPPHSTARSAVDLSPTGRGKESSAQNSTWILLALAFPAVLVNIGHGHNGFLTAALMGYALVMLDRRPVLAGILFGLLSYKPQFGLLIPLVLIASGRWRTLAAAAATVAVLIVATTLVFGTDVWRAFFTSMHLTRVEVLEAGGTGWHKIQSVFAWVRMWGGGVPLAYAAQGAVTFAVACALVWLWRSEAAYPVKAAALAIGAILATPYSLDYDMMVLAPAIAYLAADGMTRGFNPWEKSALALLWFVPLFARAIAEHTLIPIGVFAMLAVFVFALRRAANDNAAVAPRSLNRTKTAP
jgi:alpha-1,2-mannosyltransferase